MKGWRGRREVSEDSLRGGLTPASCPNHPTKLKPVRFLINNRLLNFVGTTRCVNIIYVVEESKKRNPNLADLERLSEMFPPKRLTYWPYLIVKHETG